MYVLQIALQHLLYLFEFGALQSLFRLVSQPYRSEPVTLNFAEEHMMEKHSDIIIPRPEDMEEKDIPRLEHMEEKQGDLINPRPEPVSGPSFTTVSSAGDTPSQVIHDPDQERSVIKVFNEGLKLLISYCY